MVPLSPRRGAIMSLSILAMLLTTAACSADPATPSATSQPIQSSTTGDDFPVTLENCERSLTFQAPPEHVVTLWQAPTEMLLALGLGDRIAAIGGSYADLPDDLAAAAEGIPVIGAETGWPTREVLLSMAPDLVVPQLLHGFAFDTSRGFASVEELESGGAQVYSANSCSLADNQNLTLDTVSDTLRELGAIFGVSERADEIVTDLQEKKTEVLDAVAGLPTVRTAYYNGGNGPLTVLSGGNYSDLITSARGENVFPDDALNVSIEEFAASDAEVILVGTYPGQDFATSRAYLTSTFPELPAVRDGRIVEVPVAETDVSVRIMDGFARIAAALHPDAGITVPAS